jgi:Uma2 family endonuclease
MGSVIQVSAVHYPESDGKPMAESDVHRDAMIRHIQILQHYYKDQRVYVSGDLLVYYEQGKPRKFAVPDAFVVKGISPKRRRVYKTWIERKSPDVVIETTSRKTKRKDTVEKPELYARLGVQEYFLFDPDQEYLDPPLQGYRLSGSDYVPIEPDVADCVASQELGLRLRLEEDCVEFYRLDTGERADRAAQARQAAEAEFARLREERSRR